MPTTIKLSREAHVPGVCAHLLIERGRLITTTTIVPQIKRRDSFLARGEKKAEKGKRCQIRKVLRNDSTLYQAIITYVHTYMVAVAGVGGIRVESTVIPFYWVMTDRPTSDQMNDMNAAVTHATEVMVIGVQRVRTCI